MDQVKIGSFLKKLRNEKNLTQENLAEQLNVSNRTVSRWETGSNMPDIGILVEIAEFKQVPRFRYKTIYHSKYPNQLIHKTLFFTVIQKNPKTEQEEIIIVK